ncbi:hypothetical protein [uncultured Pontibacter sp.]|uniref:hypothetical protein n=1 Tax=uncultured Pontibacter sp. TaxID=453356 RepID=UPI00261FBDFB|nr:hypothetical protein [uncultured Pontibacter sp.]
MKKIVILLVYTLTLNLALGQSMVLPPKSRAPLEAIEAIKNNKLIGSDSTFRLLSEWKQYQEIPQVDQEYLYFYNDSVFGQVPVRIFIPKGYSNSKKSPLLLLLHGAVGRSSFTAALKPDSSTSEEDIFFQYFTKQDFIVVRPYADRSKQFDWVRNGFKPSQNLTYNTLASIVEELKLVLNIDDSKIYGLGHSDGSDGCVGLLLYKPTLFAGFIAYNSMIFNIHANNFYLRNTANRPLYIVHSDKDVIRPVEQARLIVTLLDSIKSPVLYKEYHGYEHYDEHLLKDLPLATKFLKGISRNPFAKQVYWETNNIHNKQCDWLKINEFNAAQEASLWHKGLNTISYNKIDKVFVDEPYYGTIDKSAAVTGFYQNNTFYINTSRVKELEVLISNVMVNLEEPVKIILNGEVAYHDRVSINKSFLLNNFLKNFDRQALWVNSIKLKL